MATSTTLNFGVNPDDGTLEICRAKPENRGRGRCRHFEHQGLPNSSEALRVVQQYNEETLAQVFDSFTSHSLEGSKRVSSPVSGESLTLTEFHDATNRLDDAFTEESWTLFKDFYSEFSTIISENGDKEKRKVISGLVSFLSSDDDVAKNVRRFLGPEVDLNTFSEILVSGVRAMTASVSLKNGGKFSISRVIATSCANDMTRKRYIASVLFFGGRCCYCHQVMNKEEGSARQATGEHLTPSSPSNPDSPIGVTRYGNMALACRRCNESRGNADLNEWIEEYPHIDKESKKKALDHIESFRRFALYEEYSPAQSRAIRKAVDDARRAMQATPKSVHITKRRSIYSKAEFSNVRKDVKEILFDLRIKLNV